MKIHFGISRIISVMGLNFSIFSQELLSLARIIKVAESFSRHRNCIVMRSVDERFSSKLCIPILHRIFYSHKHSFVRFTISSDRFACILPVQKITRLNFPLVCKRKVIGYPPIHENLLVKLENILLIASLHDFKQSSLIESFLIALYDFKVFLFTVSNKRFIKERNQTWFQGFPCSWKRRNNENEISFFFFQLCKLLNECIGLRLSFWSQGRNPKSIKSFLIVKICPSMADKEVFSQIFWSSFSEMIKLI